MHCLSFFVIHQGELKPLERWKIILADFCCCNFPYMCDMIKGNESDVGNIDFELQTYRGDKF